MTLQNARRTLAERLDALRALTINVSELTLSGLTRASTALFTSDAALFTATIDDLAASQALRELREQSYEALATHTPVASDLRTMLGNLQIADALANTTGLVVAICQTGRQVASLEFEARFLRTLGIMSRAAESNLQGAIDSYSTRNLTEATIIRDLDTQLDELAETLRREMGDGSSTSGADPRIVAAASRMSVCFEQIGDNSVAISDHVVFMLTGTYPRTAPRSR